MIKKICSNCNHYEVVETSPVGYDKNRNDNPDTEGICHRLTQPEGNIGIITDPDMGDICVTSNFGCILFKKKPKQR
jgi:hypothetical protein